MGKRKGRNKNKKNITKSYEYLNEISKKYTDSGENLKVGIAYDERLRNMKKIKDEINEIDVEEKEYNETIEKSLKEFEEKEESKIEEMIIKLNHTEILDKKCDEINNTKFRIEELYLILNSLSSNSDEDLIKSVQEQIKILEVEENYEYDSDSENESDSEFADESVHEDS